MNRGDNLRHNNRREEGLLHVLCEHGLLHGPCEIPRGQLCGIEVLHPCELEVLHQCELEVLHQYELEVLHQYEIEVPRRRFGLRLLLLDHESGLRRISAINHRHHGLRSLVVLHTVGRVTVQ